MKQAVIVAALCAAGCASVARPPTTLPEVRPGYVAGYLDRAALPDLLPVIPPPPAAGSAAQLADEASYRALGRLQGSARWKLAASDANLLFPHAANVFACTLGIRIDPQATPHLFMLLRRIRMDASRANDGIKDHYKRVRPFMATRDPSCVPEEEARYKPDGYPSGHASIGWAWALALAEIAPDRANALFARGHAFGTSRAICRVHYATDIEAGRLVGAATIARLHAEPVFVAQMAEARAEIAQARAQGANAPANCDIEARALAEHP